MEIRLSDGDRDLDGILALQRANLGRALAAEEAAREGFVTVEHTRELLARMHGELPSIVAVDDAGAVVAYALSMATSCASFLPILEPMFATFSSLTFDGRPLLDQRMYVMGQICVARAWRGRGLVEALYDAHRRLYGGRFELLVTEISARNGRSLRAHARVGFEEVGRYRDATDDWVVVALRLG
jgi:ribosomal protein S18 acetylase RimI-like enzyme